MTENLTLLGIFAHPDDESFGPGGMLAKYAAEGVEVHVCIATDGAAGSYEPGLLEGYKNIAERRADELKNAVAILGVRLHKLPYRDSGMEGSLDNNHPDSFYQAPLDEVAGHIVALMRTIRPHVVVAHDPTGGYFHPDHIKVNQGVSRAWELVNEPTYSPPPLAPAILGGQNMAGVAPLPPWQPLRLYWTAFPRTWIRRFIRILRLLGKDPTRFGRNNDIDLTRLGTPEQLIHTRIDITDYLDVKLEASRQHVSQDGGNSPWMRFPDFLRRRLFGKESFTQAQPPAPIIKSDFFEGLR
ncbi:MAG: PIG-L family deacetylase [Ardenticatenaceae bacterium]